MILNQQETWEPGVILKPDKRQRSYPVRLFKINLTLYRNRKLLRHDKWNKLDLNKEKINELLEQELDRQRQNYWKPTKDKVNIVLNNDNQPEIKNNERIVNDKLSLNIENFQSPGNIQTRKTSGRIVNKPVRY